MNRTRTQRKTVLLVLLTGLVVIASITAVGAPALNQQHPATQSGADAGVTSPSDRLDSVAVNRSSHTSNAGWNMSRVNAANTLHINTTGPTNPITTRWKLPLKGDKITAGPVVVNGTVYFGTEHSDDNKKAKGVYAVDAWTGEVRWTARPTNQRPNHMVVYRNTVYVSFYGNKVYALDAATGEVFWSFAARGNPRALALADGTLYVASGPPADTNHVYALGALRGEKRWRFTTDRGRVHGMAVKGGHVYISTRYGNVYALNGETGAKNWKVVVKDGQRLLTPSVANGIVYVGTKHNDLYALNAESGEERWNRHIKNAGGIRSPSLLGNTAYFSGKYLHAVNAKTGTDRWTVQSLRGTPILLNDIGYISKANTLYTLDPKTGVTHARFTAEDPDPDDRKDTLMSRAVFNGTMYTGVGFDKPTGLAPPSESALWALGTPEFTYSNLSVTPRSAELNETVTLTATVTNTGTGPGSYNATMVVEGDVVDTTTDRLDAGTSTTVRFTATFSNNGTYTVGIDGLTRKIAVGDAPPPPTPTPTVAATPTEPGTSATSPTEPATVTPTTTTTPGFGLGVALVTFAVLVAVIVACRRD